MIVIICTKYKKNPSRTADATERTRFSKSRSNDLEDIGQGQGSSHATHPLMLLIICTKYGKNPSRTVGATERTRNAGRTDGQTGGRTDRRTGGVKPIYPQQLRCVGGIIKAPPIIRHYGRAMGCLLWVLRREKNTRYCIYTMYYYHLVWNVNKYIYLYNLKHVYWHMCHRYDHVFPPKNRWPLLSLIGLFDTGSPNSPHGPCRFKILVEHNILLSIKHTTSALDS